MRAHEIDVSNVEKKEPEKYEQRSDGIKDKLYEWIPFIGIVYPNDRLGYRHVNHVCDRN